MICSPCRHELHEFCRLDVCDCDCATATFVEIDAEAEIPDDAWQQGQDRYEAQMYRDELT